MARKYRPMWSNSCAVDSRWNVPLRLESSSQFLALTNHPKRKVECHILVFSGYLCHDGMAIGLVLSTVPVISLPLGKLSCSRHKRRCGNLFCKLRSATLKLVAVIALTLASVSFLLSIFLRDAKTIDEVFTLLINGFLTILVAIVPQGLPSTVVSLLSLAARRMALRSVPVRRIDCVETLGSCYIICSDETGTLTKNELTVTDIWYNQKFMRRHQRETESLFSQDPQTFAWSGFSMCHDCLGGRVYASPFCLTVTARAIANEIGLLNSETISCCWEMKPPQFVIWNRATVP
jgi:hypothetical protein